MNFVLVESGVSDSSSHTRRQKRARDGNNIDTYCTSSRNPKVHRESVTPNTNTRRNQNSDNQTDFEQDAGDRHDIIVSASSGRSESTQKKSNRSASINSPPFCSADISVSIFFNRALCTSGKNLWMDVMRS